MGEIRRVAKGMLKKWLRNGGKSLVLLLLEFPDCLKGDAMKPPSLTSILLGLIPFIATCFSVSLWDRIYPMVLGIPFNLFWVILWLFLTPLCMWGAYQLERARSAAGDREQGGTR